MTIRLMTYNIRGCLGIDGRRDVDRIADVIRVADVDVACLQEVHRRMPQSGFVDQPQRLARLTMMECVFHPTINWLVGGFGNAILTRRRPGGPDSGNGVHIEKVDRHRLPWMGEPRGLLQIQMTKSGKSFTVFNTHFGLHYGEREDQAKAAEDILKAEAGPLLVCGDFNEGTEGRAVQLLIKAGGHLKDLERSDEPTYPADHPAHRLDLILGRGTRLIRSQVIDTRASDHRPVVVEIDLD
jgi:endonuclease/exonuclease/phosphatase family metal-dependent hydrolase